MGRDGFHFIVVCLFQIAGGDGISVMLPKWSPDDKLMYIHDKTNWWNLYKLDEDNETSLCPQNAEIGQPAWVFGGSPYSCNPNGNGEILTIHGSVFYFFENYTTVS